MIRTSGKVGPYLKDHPMTCKWLMTMVSKSPNWVFGPFPPGHSWLMILTTYKSWDDPPSTIVENRPKPKGFKAKVFQASFFTGELSNFGGVLARNGRK